MPFNVPSDFELAQAMGGGGYGSGPEAMPYRQDFLNNVYGPTSAVNGAGFYGPGETSWRSDPSRNPALQRTTVDDQVLAYNEMAHNLAQEAFKRGQVNQAKQRIAMLTGLKNSGQAPNVFGKPNSQEEADLQRFIQEDINAGYRGWKLIPTAAQKRALARQQQADALKQRAATLNEAKYREQIARDQATQRKGESAQALAQRKFDELSAYQDAGLGVRQYGQDQTRAIADARMKAAAQRNQGAQGNRAENIALKAVQQGMDPNDAAQLYGLDGNTAARLAGWANTYDTQDQAYNDQQQAMADALSQSEMDMRRSAYVPPERSFYSKLPFTDVPVPVDPTTLDRSQLPMPTNRQALDKLIAQGAKAGMNYDPNAGFTPRGRRLRVGSSPYAGAAESGYDYTQDPAYQDSQRFLDQSMPGDTSVNPNLYLGGFGDAFGSAVAGGGEDQIPLITDPAELQGLPRGSRFRLPNGRIKYVP